MAKKGEFGEPVLIAVYHGISPKPVLPDPPPHKVLARKAVLPDYFTVIENDYEVIPLQRAPLTRDETHLTEYRVGHRKVCRNAKKICDVSKKDEVLPDITSISFTPTWTLYEALKLCSPRKDFSLQMHTRGMLIALANNDWDSVHGDAECILEESDCDPQRRALALYWRGEALKHLGHPRRGEKDQNEAKHLLPDVAHVKTPF